MSVFPEPVEAATDTCKHADSVYSDARSKLADAAYELIRATIYARFPTLSKVDAEGEWNEDGELRITLEFPDELPPSSAAEWDAMTDELLPAICWLIETTGDDWLGSHAIDVITDDPTA